MTCYFFDLDNTVTPSRSEIHPAIFDTLNHIKNKVIISGASEEQMRSQLGGLRCAVMSQNGNVNSLWKRLLTTEEQELILKHIELYSDKTNPTDKTENRGAQVSYSFVGHHAPLEIKKTFDPTGEKRRKMLETFPLPAGIEAKIAGTTCIDYLPIGLNKGTNILKYIELKGWKRRDCIYVGDALFPGGNDETVIGVIPAFSVKMWRDTLEFLTT